MTRKTKKQSLKKKDKGKHVLWKRVVLEKQKKQGSGFRVPVPVHPEIWWGNITGTNDFADFSRKSYGPGGAEFFDTNAP